MKLLYRTAEWHGLAKLRMHTESSLALLESLTTEFGLLIQNFQELTCLQYALVELPREVSARQRRELNNDAARSSRSNANQAVVNQSSTTASAENTIPPAPTAGSNSDQTTILVHPLIRFCREHHPK